MLKKVLYIIASLILGFMIILYVVNSSFYTTFGKMNAEAVAEKDYEKVEKFFSRAFDADKFYAGDIEGEQTHIEIYSALNDGIRTHVVKNEAGEETSNKPYYTLETSIQVSLFHLPSDFKMGDVVEGDKVVSQGGVKFVFSETENVFFPFTTDNFDYYAITKTFSFLALSVSDVEYYQALDAKSLSHDLVASKVEIYDGAGDLEYTIAFAEGKNPTFDTKFHETFKATIEEYNALQLKAIKGEEVSQEEMTAMENKYLEVADNSGYALQHSTKIIYRSSRFITSIVLAAVIYTAVVVGIGWLIFRKKKAPKYIPPGYRFKQQQAAVKREPEQFSRDVFNAEEDAVVENTTTPEGE